MLFFYNPYDMFILFKNALYRFFETLNLHIAVFEPIG